MNKKQTPTKVRHLVVAATTLMAVLLYLDRFCISMSVRFIQEELLLTRFQVGVILSSFFYAYALGQVPSGWLSDRFGARKMLTFYIVLWSLFTACTGIVYGFFALLVIRIGFGLGQAGAYPTAANVISKWVLFSARGTASGIVSLGGRFGGWLAPILTGWLIVHFVPFSVPSTLRPEDLLDVPRLSYELTQRAAISTVDNEGTPAARILSKLSSNSRATVDQNAIHYASAVEGINRKDEPAGEKHGKQGPAGVVAPPDDDIIRLSQELNQIVILQPGFFQASDAEHFPLESEARRLFSLDQPTAQQSQRLNRLVLEAMHRESVLKVYGAGWRKVMFVYGAFGIIVAAVYWLVVRDRPQTHPRCNPQEIMQIESSRPADAANPHGQVGMVPWRGLLTNYSMWCNCITQWWTNCGWVFLVTWLPTYLDEEHHVPIAMRGLMTSIPIMIGWLGMFSGGFLTDRLVGLIGLRWGRALPVSLSRFLAMAAYLYCLTNPSPWAAVAAFSLVAFATDMGTPALWAFQQDVGGRYTASVLGWANMWGNFGAAAATMLVGWLVDRTESWNAVFIASAAAFCLSGLFASQINATQPISSESDLPPEK
jgi:sugar phosphate permease